MKLMIISDIHGSSTFLKKALEQFNIEKPNRLIILGDILYHGPRNPLPEGYDPKGVIEQLNSLKELIIAVRGNCDSEVDQMVLEFPLLSDYQQLHLGEQGFMFSHGHLFDNEPPKFLSKNSIYMQGHTHVPMIRKNDGVYHVNPGSITLPKEDHPNTYAIYEHNQIIIKTLDGIEYLSVTL